MLLPCVFTTKDAAVWFVAFPMEGPRRLTASTTKPLEAVAASRRLTARLASSAVPGSAGYASRKLLRGHTVGCPSSTSCETAGSTLAATRTRETLTRKQMETVACAGAQRPARPRSPARKLQRLTETGTRSVPGRYQTFSAGTLASDTGWLEKAAVIEKVYQRYGDFVTDILKHAG